MITLSPRQQVAGDSLPFSFGSLSTWRIGLLLLLCHGSVWQANLEAAGAEATRRQQDIVLTVDSRWAGGTNGGYYPIRIQAINKGPTCDLRLVFSSRGTGGSAAPIVERLVTVEQNAAVRFTLSIPLVGLSSYGQLTVYRNGREMNDLATSHSFTSGQNGERPALLVIDPDLVDCNQFEVAANSAGRRRSPSGYYGGASGQDHIVVPPISLPETWIDYSCLDLIAVSLENFRSCTPQTREAILKWVDTGGNLIFTEVGTAPQDSVELRRLLGLSVEQAREGWKQAEPQTRQRVQIFDTASENQIPSEFNWEADSSTFAFRPHMLGTIVAFPDDPFPGKAGDWAWLLQSLTAQRWQWTLRTGLSARLGSNEFLEFLIPGVGGVPIVAFLVLITLFTIVIGPLNYILLWRRKQLYLLVITIPVIAFTTTCALAGYAMISDGFGVKSRVISYTLLDHTTNSAVALNRISLYAGMAPSSGLTFSPETVVLPFWPRGEAFRSGNVDWTNNDQRLTGGWLRSRTRTQFVTIAHRAERGRLEVTTGSDETRTASNGYAWDFKLLLVADSQGRLYEAENVSAGSSVKLSPVDADAFQRQYRDLLQASPLSIPEGAAGQHSFYYSPHDENSTADFNMGLLWRNLQSPQNLQGNPLPAGAFLAVSRENPGTEKGLKGSAEYASLHVLRGEFIRK